LQQLSHSEKLAIIGQMATRMAHEVRNPLSAVSLNLALLADEVRAAPEFDLQEVESLLESLQTEVNRITQILDEYLRYARLPKLLLQPGNLNTVVKDLCQFLEPEIKKANVKLILSLDDNLLLANIDAGQLRLVGINLVRNALDAMPQGGKLHISTIYQKEQMELKISDTGVGIHKENLETIFQPFYSTKPGGTGLGLPYAQEIVHAHGGGILCESSPGKGTSFTVIIPLAK